MPSPSIPRSQSAPRISGTPHSPSHSDVPSRWTSWSENSSRTWPKKVGNFIARKTASSSSSKKSILTEESLKEFNRLNEIREEKRYFQSSPYYRGLTDSSLVINRQRPSLPSPDRESTSSNISFVSKVQEWGSSFFTAKDKEEKISQPKTSSSKCKSSRESLAPTQSQPSSASSSKRQSTRATTNTRDSFTKTAKKLGSERKEVNNISTSSTSTTSTDVAILGLNQGKPLRERVSKPPSPPPTPPHQRPEISLPQAPPTQTQPQTTPQPPKTSARPTKTPSQTSPAEKIVQEKETKNKPENDRKFIWADKYRPSTLKDFLCNRSKALELQASAKSENCGHFIFEGRPGVGKRTMIWALLRETFGEDRVEAREETKKFILKPLPSGFRTAAVAINFSGTGINIQQSFIQGEAVGSINVNIKQWSKHVEINLSELRGYEKHIIVELIKEKNDKSSNKILQCNFNNCRAIILYDTDKLPTEALLYIRWLLERYKGCNKFFFCCSDSSKIQPLSSLCTVVQLLPPSTEEIIEVLVFIAEKEGTKLPHQLAAKIAKSSKNNLRQAIRSFEATWRFNSFLEEDQEIMTGWEDDIANIARNIIEEQSPKQLYNIRGKLQNLIEHNVSPKFIFETLVKELKENLDEQLRTQIDSLYEKYNQNDNCEKPCAPAPNRQEEMGKRLNDPVRKTVQQFMRIEEFIAKFMSWYKGLVVKNKETQNHVF